MNFNFFLSSQSAISKGINSVPSVDWHEKCNFKPFTLLELHFRSNQMHNDTRNRWILHHSQLFNKKGFDRSSMVNAGRKNVYLNFCNLLSRKSWGPFVPGPHRRLRPSPPPYMLTLPHSLWTRGFSPPNNIRYTLVSPLMAWLHRRWKYKLM
jgi:hypothetical protein